MEQPGHQCGQKISRHRIAGQIIYDNWQQLALTQRLGGLSCHFQRHDEQADADEDAANLAPVPSLGGHENRGARNKAERHKQGQIIAQDLDDKRRSKFAAAHSHQARNAAHNA